MKKLLTIFVLGACVAVQASAQEQAETKAYMVADAHLDTQWNWDIQTTLREFIPATMRQNIYLMETYPEYIFNFEGAVKYYWMKEYYPDEYEKVKKYVEEGRWHLTGSSWDACETIVCSSESWMRNIALGQSWYRQEFGLEGTDVFLPDCFGFPYNMPTMMRHCGLIGFSSQKLQWRENAFYEGGLKFPFNVGLWKGIDGSKVMMVHGYNYTTKYPDSDVSANEKLQKDVSGPLNVAYHYYGTGDRGGSPDIPSVRAVMKGLNGSGPVKVISATSDQLYKDFLPYDAHPELPEIEGEMTMDVHGNGCYTSQAAMKLYNRLNEHLGDAAERAAVTADWLGAAAYPSAQMTETWRNVIWHQFHDDLTGTSIPRAYEFSWNDELIALSRFSDVLTNSVNGIAAQMNTQVSGTPVVLYNPEAFEARALAEVLVTDTAAGYTVKDPKGKTVPSQLVTGPDGRHRLLFSATVPPTGAAVYSITPGRVHKSSGANRGKVLENSVYRLTVDACGNVSSIIDKRSGRELVAEGKALGLVVFDDCKSYRWPAWEIPKAIIDRAPVPVQDGVKVERVENGPVRQTLRIEKRYGESLFVQYVSLCEGPVADRIDFRNEVDWQSENALLKMNFPLNVSNEEATYDLGLGSVRRGNNRPQAFEVYSHEWTDLSDRDGSYGITILNDCKYGWDKPDDSTLRLSLLYSPAVNDRYTYQARQDFGHHEFSFSLIGHAGGLDKSSAINAATLYNSPLRAFVSPKHKGSLGRQFSFVSSDNDDVIVRCLKKCETADEYFIRVYENTGETSRTAQLRFAGEILQAVEADGTEKAIGPAAFDGNRLTVELPPFGVRAFRVRLAKVGDCVATVGEVHKLELPFNRRCFSPNGFRRSADFSEGYSYAAELLPAKGLAVDGIPFSFGEKDAENGLSCNGGTLALPGGKFNKLYLLAASANGDKAVEFNVGGSRQTLTVHDYCEFYGQWGHTGQTEAYVKQAEIGWIGTHRHSPAGDGYYEYTYMFKYALDVPEGAGSVVLPDDPDIVIFAATAVNEAERISCR